MCDMYDIFDRVFWTIFDHQFVGVQQPHLEPGFLSPTSRSAARIWTYNSWRVEQRRPCPTGLCLPGYIYIYVYR